MLLLYNFINIKLTIKPNNKLRIGKLLKNKIKKSKLSSYYPLYPIQKFLKNHLNQRFLMFYKLIYIICRILECIYSLKYPKKRNFNDLLKVLLLLKTKAMQY